jgi:PIN domain nuclease of toxin-antitoxin system
LRLLLDSHVALWWLTDDRELSDSTRNAIVSADEVFVSAVTPWELGIKAARGKIVLPGDIVPALISSGFEMLNISPSHATAAARLPSHHSDPFDRMLIAQAVIEKLALVTADRQMSLYDIEIVPAR